MSAVAKAENMTGGVNPPVNVTAKQKRFYSNVLSNGDLYVGTVIINGKKYEKFIEKQTRASYILDVHTSNISFLRTSKDLYNLGIKNYRFMLKLYDTNLIDVDPYDPAISAQNIQRIIIESKRNIWYFMRDVARIPVEGGAIGPGAGMPYQLNRGNLAATWCFSNNIDHYLVLPRQIGKTKSTLENILWAFIFSSNTKMMFLCKDAGGSKANLKSLKDQRELLPYYMQSKVVINESGEKKTAKGDGQTYLENPYNHNHISTATGGTTIDAADRCGRGLTQAIQFYDEVEFTKHISTIIDAAGPAFNTASRNARENGAPYCRVFTTTPGNLDSEPVATTESFRAQTMRFSESLYDMDIEKAKEVISTNSAIDVVYIEFSYIQLGKDEKWFVNTAKKVSNDKIKIRREILLKRIRGSNTSPFEAEDLEEISASQKEPIEEYYVNEIYPVYIYERINPSIPYIVGVDVASGKVGDYCAVTIIDPYTVRPVADFRSNIQNTVKLKSFLVSLVSKLIPRAIVTIENNSMGTAVIDMLKLSSIAQNLYFDNNKYFVPDATTKMDAKGFAMLEAKNARCYGINTNSKTRAMMINILFDRVQNYKSDFVTKFVIGDLMSLVRTPLGRVEAAKGAHDDSIMSYLIGLYTLFNGSNLSRYGFVRGQVAPEPDKPKSRQEYFAELPDDVQEFFKDAMGMRTGEEYDAEARELSDRLRNISASRHLINDGSDGSGRNINLDIDEDTGMMHEAVDMSWLDDLNS